MKLLAIGLGLLSIVLAGIVLATHFSPILATAEVRLPAGNSIRDHGAVGDGKTDDTAAIQQAVDAATGAVHFPKGSYRITRPIAVDLDKVGTVAITADGGATLTMNGPGPALRFIGTHEGSADPVSVKLATWKQQMSPRLEGLDILGDHPEADGIELTGTHQFTGSLCSLRKCRHGVHLVKRNRNVILSACHIYNGTGCGVFLDQVNLHQINIVGCHISYCAGGGVVTRGGAVRNLQIGTCDIEANVSKTGPPTANVLLDCTGGSTAEVAITGCTLQHANVPGSANIRMLGLGSDVKSGQPANWGHVTITGNIFSDVAVSVDLKNCRGVTLTDNTFWMGFEYNLLVENSQQIVVGPNLFERNPAYDYIATKSKPKNALRFSNCRDCTLTGLHIQGGGGAEAALTLDTCERFNVSGCTLLDCDGVGLSMVNPRDCQVTGCLIRHDGAKQADAISIKVNGGEGNRYTGNSFSNGVDMPRELK